ncbi:hypothetical protein M3Y98_00435500 [Aphelenchoides besseyi]|nr:hypothetical protein M3Y98_00435500 [Aphelenchoides besseyi]
MSKNMKGTCDAEQGFYYAILELVFRWLPNILISVSLLAVLVNFLLLLVISIGIYRKKVPAKRLLFVANRSLVDAIAAAISLIYLCKAELYCDVLECQTKSFVPDVVMQMIITLDYWSLSGTYLGIASLTFYAVRTPLHYKLSLNVSRVAKFIVIGWVIIIGLLLLVNVVAEQQAMFDANGVLYLMKNTYYGLLGDWMVALCEKVIDKSMVETGFLSLTLPVMSYIITIMSYGFVVTVLFRRRNDRRTISQNRDHTALWRLGVHLGVFTFSFLLMAVAYAATFPMADTCLNWSTSLIENYRTHANNEFGAVNAIGQSKADCHLEHMFAFTRYVVLTSLAACGWFMRMSLDPIIDATLDMHIRRLVFGGRSVERASTTLLLENRLSAEPQSATKS